MSCQARLLKVVLGLRRSRRKPKLQTKRCYINLNTPTVQGTRPGWRNWQTQRTQNPPRFTPRGGSTPPPGTTSKLLRIQDLFDTKQRGIVAPQLGQKHRLYPVLWHNLRLTCDRRGNAGKEQRSFEGTHCLELRMCSCGSTPGRASFVIIQT